MNASKPQPQPRSIMQEIEIAAPAEVVWQALTDAAELVRWFPTAAGSNPDGTVWMAFGEDFRFSSRVEAAERPRRLRTVPVLPPEVAASLPPMFTEITLEARGGSTVLRLVQSGFATGAGWDEEYEGTRTGWIFQLAALKHYLERHRGTDRELVWVRKIHGLPRAEAWARVERPGGLFAEGLESVRAGHRYRLTLGSGDVLEGVVTRFDPPRDFSATVATLNDALLRIQCDDLPMRGVRDTHFWLNTYGLPAGTAAELRARVTALLGQLFPEAAAQKAPPTART